MKLIQGDCLEVLKGMPDNSVDAIVTDPPYGLGKEPDALKMLTDWIETGHHDVKGRGFMGKEWDSFVPQPQVWRECLRVLKPGGHLLAFAGTRTQDLMALGLRLAGFEIRDMIAWVYGSGFPKSLDVSKAIDKAAGAEREVVGENPWTNSKLEAGNGVSGIRMAGSCAGEYEGTRVPSSITAPATDAAREWAGWGTALKPALEPITLARKPFKGTVAANVLEHGTGAINVDECRVGSTVETWPASRSYAPGQIQPGGKGKTQSTGDAPAGRWPANLIHDGSEEVVGLFPVTTSGKPMNKMHTDPGRNVASGASAGGEYFHTGFGDTGSAARFFKCCPPETLDLNADRFRYCAKASKTDRNEGCEHFPEHQEGLQLPRGKCKECGTWKNAGEERCKCGGEWELTSNPPPKSNNNHPTVKPTDLMRYLVRLVTPPGGVILDPYMGSGSTGKAAIKEGFQFVGIERDPDYFQIAKARIENEIIGEFEI